jgi:hypothetical protein
VRPDQELDHHVARAVGDAEHGIRIAPGVRTEVEIVEAGGAPDLAQGSDEHQKDEQDPVSPAHGRLSVGRASS